MSKNQPQKASSHKEFMRYLQHLRFTTKSQKVSYECWGGSWYISSESIDFIYKNRMEVGLLPLNLGVSGDDVGEYFADLIIYKSEVYRIIIDFKLYPS